MYRRLMPTLLVLVCLGLILPRWVSAAPPAQPNIILIMGDDHPWNAYSFMKAIDDSGTFPTPTSHPDMPPITTPNFDRLAARGAVFPVAAAGASVCIPSFHSTLAGFYPDRFTNSDEMIPSYLAGGGYISYGFGKVWQHGYEAIGFTEGGIRSKKIPRETVQPVLDFIDSRAPGGPPWFIWYSPHLPHGPFRTGEPYQFMFNESDFPRPRRKGVRLYGNIMALDTLIGQLLDGLSARGIDDQVMLIYHSDNGFYLPNSKRRSGENGFRTPILISWPGVVPSQTVLPQMVHAIDLLPTMLDYAGVAIPGQLEGESMRPYMEDPGLAGREYLFSMKPAGRPRIMLRTQDGMRLTSRFGAGSWRFWLYDLKTDPDEKFDLFDAPQYQSMIPIWTQAIQDFHSRP